MGAEGSNDESLLMRAVDSIGYGTTLDEAFASLVEVLRAPLELWHANLAILRPGTGTAEIVAAWSVAGSVFEPGTEVSTDFSGSVRASAEALREDKLVMGRTPSSRDSLVDQLMLEQGVVAAVSVPIHHDAGGVVVLTMGSSEEEPLKAAGEPFFRGLAAGVEERLVQLLASRAR